MEARGESAPGWAGLREFRIPPEEPRLVSGRRHPCKVTISLRDPAWFRCSHSQIPCQVPSAKRPSLIGNVNDDPRKQALTWAGCFSNQTSAYVVGHHVLIVCPDCFKGRERESFRKRRRRRPQYIRWHPGIPVEERSARAWVIFGGRERWVERVVDCFVCVCFGFFFFVSA